MRSGILLDQSRSPLFPDRMACPNERATQKATVAERSAPDHRVKSTPPGARTGSHRSLSTGLTRAAATDALHRQRSVEWSHRIAARPGNPTGPQLTGVRERTCIHPQREAATLPTPEHHRCPPVPLPSSLATICGMRSWFHSTFGLQSCSKPFIIIHQNSFLQAVP
jgi:hypothetical protein